MGIGFQVTLQNLPWSLFYKNRILFYFSSCNLPYHVSNDDDADDDDVDDNDDGDDAQNMTRLHPLFMVSYS